MKLKNNEATWLGFFLNKTIIDDSKWRHCVVQIVCLPQPYMTQ